MCSTINDRCTYVYPSKYNIVKSNAEITMSNTQLALEARDVNPFQPCDLTL